MGDQQTFLADLLVMTSWRDRSLEHNSAVPHLAQTRKELNDFWIPQLYFPNAKKTKAHGQIRANMAFRVFPNGTVTYSTRFGPSLEY